MASPTTAPPAPPSPAAQAKLKTIEELAEVAALARTRGETVVLAHGTFDLMHIGHLRHLRQARREGSMLIVTLTADAFVNKGPGRPVFSEHMRAEMLAALECVDHVGVHHAKTAVDALYTIRPDVYAKGSDYKNADDDVTGGIVEERRAVESHGGRIAFTDDVTFSSSALINRHLNIFDPTLDEYLEAQREKGVLDSLQALLDKVKDYRVLMIGDAIIDEYQYVSAMGKSPKEHMIATLFDSREVFAGGVFAAANHVADFCKKVEVVTTIGDDGQFEKTIRQALRTNVRLNAFRRPNAPTTCKTRFIDQSYLRKMFEVYHMDDAPTPPEIERQIEAIVRDRADEFDLVIVTDFGHGLLTPSLVATLEQHAKFLAVNAQSNSANMGYNLITRYPRADYVCIDAPEARLAVSDRSSDIETIVDEVLPSRMECPRIIVTHGRYGCVGRGPNQGIVRVPAFTKTVVDTVGAGDAFFAVTAPLAAAGGRIDQLAFIGNAAGAIKVGIVGHRASVERVPLIKFLTTLLK
ncbi:MAG: adenylyltransferase/cytidyltransferase family protein [Rhodobacterales bacterium]|nr:adenylyltransferase/cytidyltransferase family protein [Rhodobacterales bacterium]